MVDASGTTVYGYTTGGQLWTENGPFDNDTVTITYANGLKTGWLGAPWESATAG